MAKASYDEFADWYDSDFLDTSADHRLGIDRALCDLLGKGSGECLEIGCGTGVLATRVRQLGWSPIGVDISAGMLRHAVGRLPVVQADAEQLPFASESMSAVIAVMVHTDMSAYPAVMQEAARVLQPHGIFVHIGVHPCFCGGFADRSDPAAVVIHPGYLKNSWTKESWTDRGLRDKVGAVHWPLPELMQGFLDACFVLEKFSEGDEPTPLTLGVRARAPYHRLDS